MNEMTLQKLGYFQIKEHVMEYTISFLGKRYVDNMLPMTRLTMVRNALNEASEALAILNSGASVPIPSLEGMEMILQLSGTGYVFSEQDFSNLQMFLRSCKQLKTYMSAKTSIGPRVSTFAASMYELTSLKNEIERCIRNGRIMDSASKDLNKIRKKISIAEDRIKSTLDALLKKHRAVLQESLVSKRGERYVLPVKKERRKQVPGTVLDESASGQTVFIEPHEIAHLQYELVDLHREEAKEEAKLLSFLTGLTEEAAYEIQMNVEVVGTYDFIFAKAKYAQAIGGGNAGLNDEGIIEIHEAVHPLLGKGMVPLDFSIGREFKSLIITGPNTGGKTVALKTIGLLTLMIQSGLLVSVGNGSTFSVFKNVAVDIGDGQNMEQSLSTFSAHIRNVVEILKHADHSTLVLVDEMASGTDPGEGVGLSISVLEELYRRGAKVVVTTHFNEIKEFARTTPGFENARMEFDADTLQPLYRLRIGEAGQSYALFIALKLGMNPDIIRRSSEIISNREGKQICLEQAEAVTEAAPLSKMKITPKKQEKREFSAKDQAAETRSGQQKRLEVGDCVYVSYLRRTGIVYAAEDAGGNVGVMIRKQKLKINKKRLTLHIDKKELYPDDYDFDIIFETKENRKKRKLMNRKYVEDLTINTNSEEQ